MITEWHPSARQGAAHSADSIHLMSHAAAIQLVERLSDQAPLPPAGTVLQLPLAADQRTSLRGHRRSACGLDLLLQLPRGAALRPGERLATEFEKNSGVLLRHHSQSHLRARIAR